MTEKAKLLSLLKAIADRRDPDEVEEGFETPRERSGMLQLAVDEGLITCTFDGGGDAITSALKPNGRAVLSGERPSPFDAAAPVANQTFHVGTISGGNVQFGNQNIQNIDVHVQSIVSAIVSSNASVSEKRSLLSSLYTFASNPALGNALQALGVIMAAIEKLPK